jgi:hypothetical protein
MRHEEATRALERIPQRGRFDGDPEELGCAPLTLQQTSWRSRRGAW